MIPLRHLPGLLLLLSFALRAHGQPATPATPAPAKVYTYVEQMPELPGGGGNAAIASYIAGHTHIPLFCGSEPLATRIIVAFIVTETGDVSGITVVRSIDARVDAAVVAAVRSMPCLQPGRHQGQPVRVQFAIPIIFDWQR